MADLGSNLNPVFAGIVQAHAQPPRRDTDNLLRGIDMIAEGMKLVERHYPGIPSDWKERIDNSVLQTFDAADVRKLSNDLTDPERKD